MDWQKTATLCNIGAFVVAVVWGTAQFYIWYKHGEIGMSSMVGFGVLVVILFISGVIRLMAPRSGADTHRTTALPVDAPTQSSMSVVQAPAPSITITEKGTATSLSPQELVRLFKTGGTSAQANRLIQPYIGKRMQVSGVVHDVAHYGAKTSQVSFMQGISIVMYFGEKWLDDVSMLVKGENITVRGHLRSIEYGDMVVLEDCELVS